MISPKQTHRHLHFVGGNVPDVIVFIVFNLLELFTATKLPLPLLPPIQFLAEAVAAAAAAIATATAQQ